MEKLYRIKESTLRNLTESVKNITGKTEEVIVVGNISNEINYKVEELDNEIVAQTTLISEQDAKIAELAEVLSGKAGGGSSSSREIDVCNLTISSFNDIHHLSYTAYENNAIVAKCITSASTNFTLLNVVCGSAISFYNSYDFNGFTHSSDSKFLGRMSNHILTLSAPTVPNIDATITIFDDN